MSEEFKIKGAADIGRAEGTTSETSGSTAVEEQTTVDSAEKDDSTADSKKKETSTEDLEEDNASKPVAALRPDTEQYPWYKVLCAPDRESGRACYYLNFKTQAHSWTKPTEPFWLWNDFSKELDTRGLQQPTGVGLTSAGSPDFEQYPWYKILCEPKEGRDHYFTNWKTQESSWVAPSEPYWLWNHHANFIDPSGTYEPTADDKRSSSKKPQASEDYEGYNPKIHGNYDPNAWYAKKYEDPAQNEPRPATAVGAEGIYSTTGAFNRFTGKFEQSADAAERHSDANKSSRQMNAYFDYDTAANSHDGRSLKEERRNQVMSKKQVKEMADRRREKKEKKRMAWLKS